jgi:hypothetical protein
MPTLGLLVILYIGTLLPKQLYIYNSILRFYYITFLLYKDLLSKFFYTFF